MGHCERDNREREHNMLSNLLLPSLALVQAGSLPEQGVSSQANWIDVCSYHDDSGSRCCAPGMEGHRYMVLSNSNDWSSHLAQCDSYGGWLTVFETRDEWACIEHYVSQAYGPSSQRYAISLRSDFGSDGIYKWQYADGSQAFPQFEVWAPGHPQDDPCVSMEVDGGQWIDGDCYEDRGIFAICEKAPPTTTTTTTREPTSTKPDEVTTTESWPEEWTDVCNYEDNSGDKGCSSGMRSQEYKVRTVIDDWDAQWLECSEDGGNLVIFETQEEWACIQHWVRDRYRPASPKKFAIGLRSDFGSGGIYKWLYGDGSQVFPDFFMWADNHPQDDPCVSMEVGEGADSQGAWIDGDCVSELIYAVCEREQK